MKKIIFVLGLFCAMINITSCVKTKNLFLVKESVPEDIQESSKASTKENEDAIFDYSIKEIELYNQGQKIYGVAYIPKSKKKKLSLVICSHGLGGSYQSTVAYAEGLAKHGIAAYSFDFRGGGGKMSDGATTEMSVMTEVSDLAAIITAARHADKIAGAMLCYPAFLVTDDLHNTFKSLEDVSEKYNYQWIVAGKIYAEDMWNYDVYSDIGKYNKKVLLLHGDKDSIVNISYSEKATTIYKDVDFHVIKGAGHGFKGDYFDEAIGYILEYMKEIDAL